MLRSPKQSALTAADLRHELVSTVLEPVMAELAAIKEQINHGSVQDSALSGKVPFRKTFTARATDSFEKVTRGLLDLPSKRGWRVMVKDATPACGVGLLFRRSRQEDQKLTLASESPSVELVEDTHREIDCPLIASEGLSLEPQSSIEEVDKSFPHSTDSIGSIVPASAKDANYLQRIFDQLDGVEQSDESPPGYMTLKDLHHALDDEALLKNLEKLGIDSEECHNVFRELDELNVGLVSVNEFVSQCYLLRARRTGSGNRSSYYRLKDVHVSEFDHEENHNASRSGARYGAFCAAMERNIWFNYICGFAVVASALSAGIETDYRAKHWSEDAPIVLEIFDLFLCTFFCAEHVFRVVAFGLPKYLRVHGSAFPLDFTCVCVLSLESCLRWTNSMRGFLALGCPALFVLVRVIRLVRVVYLFDLLKVSTDFRKLWFCVIQSVKSLFWTCCLILGIVYITGVYLTQVVTNHKLHHGETNHELQHFFGTLDRTLLSLYEAMSDGIEWVDLVVPLREEISLWAALAFALCMAFVMFAMLNVITAHLCEHAVKLGKQDATVKLKEEMKFLFHRVAAAEDGTITWDEFYAQLKSDEMQQFLDVVELNRHDAILLFNVLDRGGKRSIEVDAFVNGCMRVNGPAKATDIVQMTKQWNSTVEHIEDTIQNCIREHSAHIAALIDQLRQI